VPSRNTSPRCWGFRPPCSTISRKSRRSPRRRGAILRASCVWSWAAGRSGPRRAHGGTRPGAGRDHGPYGGSPRGLRGAHGFPPGPGLACPTMNSERLEARVRSRNALSFGSQSGRVVPRVSGGTLRRLRRPRPDDVDPLSLATQLPAGTPVRIGSLHHHYLIAALVPGLAGLIAPSGDVPLHSLHVGYDGFEAPRIPASTIHALLHGPRAPYMRVSGRPCRSDSEPRAAPPQS
jgi:hypothetical protein